MRAVTEPGLRAVIDRLRHGNIGYAGFTNMERTAHFSLFVYKHHRNEDHHDSKYVVGVLVDLEESEKGVCHWVQSCFDGDTELYEIGPFNDKLVYTDTKQDAVQEVFRRVSQLQKLRVCPCDQNVYFDEADMCLSCQLTCTEEDLKKDFCAVCQDDVLYRHAVTVACCDNILHRSCYDNLMAESSSLKCPLCRKKCTVKSAARAAIDD
jgi:hypothetical protein